MLKRLPSGLYFIALILFFTPWWSAGCAQQKVISFTGVQTVTGFNLDTVTGFTQTTTNPFGMKTETKEIPPEPLVVIVALLTLGALIVGLTVKRKFLFSAGTMGFIAGILLLIYKARVDAKVLEEGRGAIQVIFENGFWATLVVLLVASASQLLIANQMEPELAPIPASAPTPREVAEPASTQPISKKSRAVLIPTEPPPLKAHADLNYMPPALRAEFEKKKGALGE